MKRGLVLFLAACCAWIHGTGQTYSYYLTRGTQHLRDGRMLPDTASVSSNRPIFKASDVLTYSGDNGDAVFLTGQLNVISRDIYYRHVTKQTLAAIYGQPTARSLNEEGDSLWFYQARHTFIRFKDSAAVGVRSIDYYNHIHMDMSPGSDEMTYTGPQEEHLNIKKEWNGASYTYTLAISIIDKHFRKRDSGQGIAIYLQNGDSIIRPAMPVRYFKNSTAVFGDLHTLYAPVTINDAEALLLTMQHVKRIRLAAKRKTIASGEAEDTLQYIRLMYKIR